MRHWPQRTVLMLILVLIIAGPAGAQQKPFTQEQVQGLVRDGLGDDTGAGLISKRGIDFQPTEDFLQVLKAAGASEAFINALRAAVHPVAVALPLTQIQVLSLVAGEVPSHRIAALVEERGITFEPGDQVYDEVRLAGGDDELINALKSAKVVKNSNFEPTTSARQGDVHPHTPQGEEHVQRTTPDPELIHHTAEGAKLMKTQHYAEAAVEYRAAVQLDPQNSDLHTSLGDALGRNGDWDAQITQEREAIRLNPGNDRAHVDLGVALSNKDDQEGAIAEYREAIRLNPNNDQAHINLGNRLSHLGDLGAALTEYQEAARLNPNSEQAHIDVASTLARTKDLNGAAAEYRQALRINPNNEATHMSLGVVLSQIKDQDGAIAEYREAIRLNPNDGQAHINLGNRLTAKGDYDGAIAEYGEAVRLNSNNAVAHYSLGTAFEHSGNKPAALQEYRTASELDPKNANYKQQYDRLAAQVTQ